MRALDVIVKKRDGGVLLPEEIAYLIKAYVAGEVPDYQMSAWLMAVFFRGLTDGETATLTDEMIASGSVYRLDPEEGPYIDKHSTGGVGDKTSLVIAPLVASLGLKVPMMSGRGLGHTGGTLDKLEALPSYRTSLSKEEFLRVLDEVNFAMIGQSAEIVPADRRLYALRDASGAVESIPLITASILSKKFAEGSDGLVFDVKFGKGAFMKNPDDAKKLAHSLVRTAKRLGKKAVALLTDMDFPLGYAVGNFFESEEAWLCLRPDTKLWEAELRGEALEVRGLSASLMEVSLELAAQMLVLGGRARERAEALELCLANLGNGRALEFFEKNLVLQGGNLEEAKKRLGTFRAPHVREIKASEEGFLVGLDAYKVGLASVYLGAGRNRAEDRVKPDVGIFLHKVRGEKVQRGEALLSLHARDRDSLEAAVGLIGEAIEIRREPIAQSSLVCEVIQSL